MKEEKKMLALNKRTIAHLNNLEMWHVRGGDGDGDAPTRTGCGDIPDKNKIIVNVAITVISIRPGVC